jgi:hypothetical protein
MEFNGSFYSLCNFARGVGLLANGHGIDGKGEI